MTILRSAVAALLFLCACGSGAPLGASASPVDDPGDGPFSFHNQVSDLTPLTIQPGDVIRTYCTFENDTGQLVTLGENTGDEMCFNFVTAYPLGALVSALPIGVSQNTCIEPL